MEFTDRSLGVTDLLIFTSCVPFAFGPLLPGPDSNPFLLRFFPESIGWAVLIGIASQGHNSFRCSSLFDAFCLGWEYSQIFASKINIFFIDLFCFRATSVSAQG